ncbi:MAG TPA: hypothetical protein VFT55_04705, partial [Planctomycetota bacterium]|nr:hypothetical protein [Planctomycetota bacterium]
MSVSPFVPQAGSGLDAEHGVVSRWVEEAVGALDQRHSHQDVELKSQPSGRIMLDATPDAARRYVQAAVVQAAFWDRRAIEIRSKGKSDLERSNPHLRAGWNDVWVRRRRATTVVSTLIRRALPFEEGDLLALLDFCNNTERVSMYMVPVGHVTRALQRFLGAHAPSEALRASITRFAARLRESRDKDAARYGTAVEQLLADPATPSSGIAEPDDAPATVAPPPAAAPAGNP